jgi:hypothetical protein
MSWSGFYPAAHAIITKVFWFFFPKKELLAFATTDHWLCRYKRFRIALIQPLSLDTITAAVTQVAEVFVCAHAFLIVTSLEL